MNIRYNAPFVIEESFFSYNPEKEFREIGLETLVSLGFSYVSEYYVVDNTGGVVVFVNMKKETPLHEYLDKLIK